MEASSAAQLVGRHAAIRSLLSGLLAGRSLLLLAGPKTGSSLLVEALAAQLLATWRGHPEQPRWVPVRVDLAALPTDPLAAARRIWELLLSAVMDPQVQSHSAPPRPPRPLWRHRAPAWPQLQAACDALFHGHANTPGWCRVALLLDQGDALMRPSAAPQRSALLAWSAAATPAWRPDAALLVGGLAWVPPPPIARRWRRLILGGLRPGDAEALCRQQGVTDPAPYLALAGGHPYILEALLAATRAAVLATAGLTDATEHLLLPAPSAAVQAAATRACVPLFSELLSALKAPLGESGRRLRDVWQMLWRPPADLPYWTTTALTAALGGLSVQTPLLWLEVAGLSARLVRGSEEMVEARGTLFQAWCRDQGPG